MTSPPNDLPPFYGKPIDTPAGHRWAGTGPEQLDLVPVDVDEQLARARADLDRLESLRTEGRSRALDAVAAAAAARTAAGEQLDQAVAAARNAGATWEQIADAVGIVRSAAWERWAHRG